MHESGKTTRATDFFDLSSDPQAATQAGCDDRYRVIAPTIHLAARAFSRNFAENFSLCLFTSAFEYTKDTRTARFTFAGLSATPTTAGFRPERYRRTTIYAMILLTM